MNSRNFLVMLLISIAIACMISPSLAIDTLGPADFLSESWAKTVDFYEYARNWAASHSMTAPPESWHAYLYMTYVNSSGLHLLYAGLDNTTYGGPASFRIPMQSFLMHYKTDNRTRDVLTASTFLMLMAFNETSTSIYPNSPDMNDTLWASFSMGFDLSALNATLPIFNSKTELLPLEHSDDKLQWSWGMTYKNLTALWWRTWITPANPHFESDWPIAITVYDELTFTYNLTINPNTNTATLTENHVIGRMRDLLLGRLPLLWVHYNSTGTYWLGARTGNDTVYDFIQNNQIKMSIVNFQTTVLLDRETYSQTPSGQNVTDAEAPVTDTSIATYADDGEKICNVDFGTKKTYRLYNYTADQNEATYDTYDATARTARAAGFAGNTGLFTYHIGLMRLLPLIVVHMYPQLYERARDTITNMSRANYFYLIAYPTYSGYRIEHDPTFTAYLTTSTAAGGTAPPLNLGDLVVLVATAAVIIIATAVIIRRRKTRQTTFQPPSKPKS